MASASPVELAEVCSSRSSEGGPDGWQESRQREAAMVLLHAYAGPLQVLKCQLVGEDLGGMRGALAGILMCLASKQGRTACVGIKQQHLALVFLLDKYGRAH